MDLWTEVLNIISTRISRPSFETWLQKTTAKIEDNVITIIAANEFQADWLEERYKTLVFDTIEKVKGETMDVKFAYIKDKQLQSVPSSEKPDISAYDELNTLIHTHQEKIRELEKRVAFLEQTRG